MNELTTTSILALFETNKEQRQSFISNLMEELDNGNIDPLKVHYQLKCIEKIIEELTNTDEKKNKDGFLIAKRYKTLLVNAVQKYGEKKFNFFNSIVEIKEVGVKYDFSKCEDVGLQAMYENQAKLSEAIKKRETLLKSVSEKGMVITDQETGETYTVYPPAKSSTTSIAITLR